MASLKLKLKPNLFGKLLIIFKNCIMICSTLEYILRTYTTAHEVLYECKPITLPLCHLDIKKNNLPGAELLGGNMYNSEMTNCNLLVNSKIRYVRVGFHWQIHCGTSCGFSVGLFSPSPSMSMSIKRRNFYY